MAQKDNQKGYRNTFFMRLKRTKLCELEELCESFSFKLNVLSLGYNAYEK